MTTLPMRFSRSGNLIKPSSYKLLDNQTLVELLSPKEKQRLRRMARTVRGNSRVSR